MNQRAEGSTIEMSAKRRALLKALLRDKAAGRARTTISRRRDSGPAPLSFAQERLWFLDQYYPNSPLYNIPRPAPLLGPLHLSRVQAVIDEIVRRHESLRTTFDVRDAQPVQVVAAASRQSLPLVDLGGLPPVAREAESLRLVDLDGRRSFDLRRGPLLRALLVRLQPAHHVLSLNMHHIISDGWSMEVFTQEFNQLYDAFSQDRPSLLPEPTIQYADYAVWQRQELQGERLDDLVAAWRQALDGASTVLGLHTDRPRPSTLSFRGATASFELTDAVAASVYRLARTSSFTPFMTLLAVFKVLLARYTGQVSLTVGFPTAGRHLTELEGLIGFFVNTLVLHTRPQPGQSFETFLGAVREVVLTAFQNQDLPFEKLVEEMQPTRSLNANPLFQVMFNYQALAAGAASEQPQPQPQPQSQTSQHAEPAGGRNGSVTISTGTSKFDLSLSMVGDGQRIGGSLEFNLDLFDPTTMRRLIDHFRVLLEGALGQPGRELRRLPLLTASERHQLRTEYQGREQPAPPEEMLSRWFEQQVRRTPEAPALLEGEHCRSYLEVERDANRLAHALKQRGVGPETVVGLLLEGSCELAVAILAVLKCGGAYLPLDTGNPADRLCFTLLDASALLVLVHAHLVDKVAATGLPVLVLDTELSVAAGQPETPPAVRLWPEQAAYVIYTSGSTGRPKGVVISHRAVASMLRFFIELLSMRPGERVLQFASPSFDVSVREVFESLLSGATLVVARRSDMLPGEPLLRQLCEARVTAVTLAPSVWAYLPSDELPDLRLAMVGGEACLQELIDRWAPGRAFFNLYGPTETAVASSGERCYAGSERPTIGWPIDNLQHLVVDTEFEMVPLGVPGELMIGGIGLARGYLRRPGLSAERFVPNPFSHRPGRRLYRTGDLCFIQPDGRTFYLGRLDFQVKIHGFRIELGEIEAALLRHPEIAATAVVCFEMSPVDRLLVAYVSSKPGGSPEPEALRAFLARDLPEYMVPHSYQFLAELPLTPAGKVDRKRLPAPQGIGISSAEYVAPRDAFEEILAAVWAEILAARQIGIRDNFFELGGHSLLVTRVVSRLRDLLEVEIPIRAFFETPTIASLAAALRQDPDLGPALDQAVQLFSEVEELDDDEIEALLEQQSAAEGGAGAPLAAESSAPASTAPDALAGAAPGDSSGPASRPCRRPDASLPVPLSFAQERLWFLDRLEPGGTAYNVLVPVPLPGPRGDAAAVARALDEVVRRHEILRTVFLARDEAPQQVARPPSALPLPVCDLRALRDADRPQTLHWLANRHSSRRYDLARGPLLRALLVLTGEGGGLLILGMHHILCDAGSRDVLRREIRVLFDAFRSGADSPLSETELQYGDFAVWQRDQERGPRLQQQLDFWRHQLAGLPPLLPLPLDYPRPARDIFRGALETFEVPARVVAALRGLARAEQATLFMVLVAGFALLLERLTGHRHLAIGTPVSSRNHSELEGMVGLMTNTLALPIDLSGDLDLRTLLRRVRAVTLDAYDHQDLPFEKLVVELNPLRMLSAHPVFQVMVILQRGVQALGRGPLQPSGGNLGDGNAKFDLTLYVEETEETLRGAFEYASDLFAATTVRRWVRLFSHLLERTAAAPDRAAGLVELTTAQRHAVLLEWGSAPSPRTGGSLPQLIRWQARQLPEAPALTGDGVELSYRRLVREIDQRARRLRQLDAGTESRIAVALAPSAEVPVWLAAVLAVGATYIYLDPELPPARLKLLLEEVQPLLVVATGDLAAGLESGTNLPRFPVLRPQAVAEEGTGSQALDLEPAPPEALAYLVYTSGSTGRPKGVMVSYRTLEAVVHWQLDRSAVLGGGLRTLQLSSLGFDVSFQEILSTWCAGGQLVLPSAGDRRDLEAVAQLCHSQRVERLFAPFAALRPLAELLAQRPGASLGLRQLITAGEQPQLTAALQRLLTALPGCRLVNQYGPSETHVVSEHVLAAERSQWSELPPIGRPVAAARLYLLDVRGLAVPPGAPGEIYIGGPGVGRGYLRRPAATAERFRPDPYSLHPGGRCYVSGDLGRSLAGGVVQFLGRRDQQVKLRGYRVEPAEVEAQLAALSGVAEAAVAVRLGAAQELELAAYAVPSAGHSLHAPSLRSALAGSLPAYMLPSSVTLLDSLPKTASGKVDRRRLPDPDRQRPDLQQPYEAPRSELETRIAEIWTELLGVERVGIRDDFFALGGHSLLGVRLTARLRQAFGVDPPLRRLFETPTIEGLATLIVQLRADQGSERSLAELLDSLDDLSDDEVATRLVGAEAE